MRRLFHALAIIAFSQFFTNAAFAVTNGELDGNGHPGVVLIVMDVNGSPAYRCSGVMVAPTYVLTAGHCAGAPGEFSGIRIFTESDVESGRGITNNYPFCGPLGNCIEGIRWAAHPLYPTASFVLHDVGMIELAEPFNLPADQYATLPAVNSLDAMATREFTAGRVAY